MSCAVPVQAALQMTADKTTQNDNISCVPD